MITYKHTCDKCKMTVETDKFDTPSNWASIRLQAGSAYSSLCINYELCPTCARQLNIPTNDSFEKKQEYIGDKLIEIISQIASEAMQQ